MARWGGQEGDGLLLHGHLDVVPAEASDWRMDPFSGEIEDGYLWGRGAVDMKDFDAMLLTVVRQRQREGRVPQRPITLCFTADEEAGGHRGAEVLINEHPEEFEGVTDAVGEVGGFSTTVRGRRIYLIEAAEKGMAWMKLTARGRAGHGSMVNADNAVARLSAAVARLGAYEWPIRLTPTMEVLLGDGLRTVRHRGDAGERAQSGRRVRRRDPDARRGHQQHRQPDHAVGRLQGQRRPDHGHRTRRRALAAGLRGRVLRHPERADRRGHRRGVPVEPATLGDAVRRPPGRRDAPQPAGRGPRRHRRAVPHERRHRRQALPQARDALLRVRTAAAAGRPRLHRAVPRRRRAGADRRAGVRRAGLDRFLDEV